MNQEIRDVTKQQRIFHRRSQQYGSALYVVLSG